MSKRIIHIVFGFLLLGLMILVPTDLLRIGLDNLSNGNALTMEIEMESELDLEDKEESKKKNKKKNKEKNKEKNKITVDVIKIVHGPYAINACGSHTKKETFGHPLAHYLEVSTPPPEVA